MVPSNTLRQSFCKLLPLIGTNMELEPSCDETVVSLTYSTKKQRKYLQ